MTTEVDDLKKLVQLKRRESRIVVLLSFGLGIAVLIGSYTYVTTISYLMAPPLQTSSFVKGANYLPTDNKDMTSLVEAVR